MDIKPINKENKYLVNVSFDEKPSKSSLIYFYAPVVGTESIFLYQLLYKESQNVFINNIHVSQERLLTILNSTEEKLSKWISKLEIVGLLTIYVNPATKDRITFVLNRPLSAFQFMNNKNLSTILEAKIGEQNILINQKPLSTNKFKPNEQDVMITKEFEVTASNDIAFNDLNISFDFSIIYELLDLRNISYSDWDSEMKSTISDAVLLYDLSIMDVVNILSSIKTLGLKISISTFKNFIQQNKEVNPDAISKAIEYTEMTTESKLRLLESLQPVEWVNILFDRQPNQEEIELIMELKSKYGLNNSVLNLLIDHSKLINEAIIPNYIRKIASTLVKNKMTDLDAAKKHLKTAYKLSDKIFKKTKKSKETIEELDFK